MRAKKNILGCECAANGIKICANVFPPPPSPQGWLRWDFLTPKWLLAESWLCPGWDSQRGGGTRGSPRGEAPPASGVQGAVAPWWGFGGEAPGKFLMVYGAKIATFYAAAASAPAASSSGRSGCSRAHSTAIKPILEHDDAADVRRDIMRVVIFRGARET